MKLAHMRTALGEEDQDSPLLQKTSSSVTSIRNHKLTAPQIRAQIIPHRILVAVRHISTSSVQRRLCESGCYGQIATAKEKQHAEEICLGQETQ